MMTQHTEEFARLFAQNHRRIYGYVRGLVPNCADADEIFQEACVVMWKEYEKFQSGTDFLAWGLTIAFNQVRSFRHRVKNNKLVYNEQLLKLLEVEQREVLEREAAMRNEALANCLQKLSESDREIVALYYSHVKRTAEDVAVQLNRPVNTIYKALERIRQSLYECIERSIASEARKI